MTNVYLIDAMSLVYRAYHAMSQANLTSPKGEPTGAIYGFANLLLSFLDKAKPYNLAVVFDRAEATFRHDKFESYKANREACPEDLVPQIGLIKEFIDLMGIPRMELAGYEADDIIGSLSRFFSKENYKVYCLTSDKDYYQLVDDNVSLYKPLRKPVAGNEFEVVDREAVREKFGVAPEQVVDVLALMGDASDNVPGVKGIGEKTAIPLVQKFGSIEKMYENLEAVESKTVRAKLEADRDKAFLSKELVCIDTNVPIEYSTQGLIVGSPDKAKLMEFFDRMGFATLKRRLEKINPNLEFETPEPLEEIAAFEQIEDAERCYELVNTPEAFAKMLEDLRGEKELAFDLETSSLDKMNCEIVGIALATKDCKAYYIATGEDAESEAEPENLFSSEAKEREPYTLLPIEDVLEGLRPLLEDESIAMYGQNAKFDAFILMRYGITPRPIKFDSMLASYLLNPDGAHNLDALSKKWLNYSPVPITTLIGEKRAYQISMRDVPPEKIAPYACEDADLAFKLQRRLKPELEKENMLALAEKIEFPLVEVLAKMELEGVSIDRGALAEISTRIAEEIITLRDKIWEESGVEFKIDSPKQLGEILFERMMIPGGKKNKTGYTTDMDTLSDLAPMFPIAKFALEYRQLQKLRSTYIEALPKLVNRHTGRIHTSYNQAVVSTGRLSSTDPNLQNIPIRSEVGKEIRRAFVPAREGWKMVSADYSQIELRIMAHITGDEALIDAFKRGVDIHAATAAALFDVDLSEVNSDMRRVAKTVNFGIMYGLGAFGLSRRLGMPQRQAKEIIDNYFESYPGIRVYMDSTVEKAGKLGYAESLLGRRRHFPEINSKNRVLRTAAERAAINMPIQGTASDMLKNAMIALHRELESRKMKSKMILQVHDELVFEAPEEEIDSLLELVKYEMEGALPLGKVPVLVETGVGSNWLEAH